MSEKRCKSVVGQVRAVLLYDVRFKGISERMRAVPMEHTTPDGDTPRGCFRFDGENVIFSEQDVAAKKFIVYESVQQVQRDTRRKKIVNLRP